MISALNQSRIKAPFVFKGYCTGIVFESYVKNILVPTLHPGQTVVLDNASFHKSAIARRSIEAAGCEVLFLPAYSPDLNPIEHYWFPIKNTIRKNLMRFGRDIYKAAEYTFHHIR
jgi:putative transposase